MNIPIDERFISTQEASEVLQIDEQVLRKLGQMGCKGIYKIGKQYRFRLKEFETVSAELSENLERLSQEVKSLEEFRTKIAEGIKEQTVTDCDYKFLLDVRHETSTDGVLHHAPRTRDYER